MINRNAKIFVAGHKGMVGSAVMKILKNEGFTNLITASSAEIDLRNQFAVKKFYDKTKPQFVILCAAKVGGIQANIDNPATFLIDNLQIQNNNIISALETGVEKFVFLGSSCIYPKECVQPMKEEYLLSGKLEPTNEGYAIAKITGIKLLEALYKQHKFESISLMPCNLYGPNDSFDLDKSHVLSALVKRFCDAKDNDLKAITLWGTGIAKREFMHVNDMARAVLFMLENYNQIDIINVGWGQDISIQELANLIAKTVNYKGEVNWDSSKPNGMLKKCMDVTKMEALGFMPEISLEKGVTEMVNFYQQSKANI